ncbi:MAG TPA: ABC transporter ATP-binding protein [Solirubrobacteraceae bacterium]|nr:ABC transporter ATP-binding protein [Solirubrobacteraceae bacterium]
MAKHFGDVVAVEDVNLEIAGGEYVVLLGPSGCGKTTILRMIGGHEHPTSGDILLGGRSLVGIPPAKRPTTTVFQHFALFPHKSVLGNVEFGLRMQGLGKEDRQKRAMEMIDLVGLSEMRFRKPSELSGGQQQRVALARVLVTKPQLLLLDEPFGDLDRLLQLRMRVELRQLQRELGIAFVHVTHNQEEALSMADRIVVMEGGHIQQVGHPAEISQRPANVFVAAFMGDNNIIQGSVKEATGGDVLVDSGLGALKMTGAPATPSVGDRVTVAVRANSVRIGAGSEKAGPNQVACTVLATEYLGDTLKVHMRAGEHPLMAKLPEQRYPELAALKDKPVMASWEATDVQLLRD